MGKLTEAKRLDRIVLAELNLGFQRTCRVPSGQVNDLPAGLGSFPLYKVEDFKSGAPKDWHEDAYFMPMYRQEAMWISFQRYGLQKPVALIVGAGNINAISGKQFKETKKGNLSLRLEEEQNYLAIPPQPWLDGWKDKDGKIYQFVAAELGSGETVEGQITGKETVGGIQLAAFIPKKDADVTPATRPREYIIGGGWEGYGISKWESPLLEEYVCYATPMLATLSAAPSVRTRSAVKSIRSIQSMGLGRGGEIRQKIYPDPYGFDAWQSNAKERTMIHLVSSDDFKQITGEEAPPTPITYKTYQQYGLPWFDIHDKTLGDTEGSDIFSKLKEVGEGKAKK